MTNVIHTQTALLVAAAESLIERNKQHKKETGAPLYKLGDDIGNGVTYRELNSWLKDFKAKQAAAGTPAPKATETKAPAGKAAPAPKADAVELKSGAIREAGELMIGRSKEKVLRISNIAGVRTVVTDKGSKIAAADLEFNNRGNLRVKLDLVDKYTAAPAAPVKGGSKAPAKAPAVEQEDFPTETPASTKNAGKAAASATEGRVFPIRDLKVKTSTQLTGAQYDRNTKTLFVTMKDKAVWAYDDMSLKDVRAFEESAQPWKHLTTKISTTRKGRMVKNHGLEKSAAQHKETSQPAPKAPTTKAVVNAAPAHKAISTTELRAKGFMDGRKLEQVEKIMRVKETDERVVITTSGKRVPLAAIIEVKGKFRVSDLALISGAMEKAGVASTNAKAGAKSAENTRKAPAKQAAQEVNGKAPRLNFAAAEGKGTAKKGTTVKPTRDEIKELGVRVTKGAKSKIVSVLRIVKRDGVSTAVSAAEGHAGLPLDLIYMNDGQPTYANTMTIAEFNAL